MIENRLCFSIKGEFGAQMSFDSNKKIPYEDLAAAVNKEKVAELLCLEAIGYTADDIEIITPEQYDEEFGEKDNDVLLRIRFQPEPPKEEA